jgi:signal peptidase I
MKPTRRLWLATLLGLVSPGLGQLYNGRLAKALLIFMGMGLLSLPLSWLAMVIPLHLINLAVPLAALLGVHVASGLDAARDARRLREEPRPWFARWYSCAVVWLLSAFIGAPLWAAVLRTFWVQAFKIPTGAMERTILIGDHLLVDKTAYGVRVPSFEGSMRLRPRQPARGDVIVFLYPEDPTRSFMKRVIGVPGDTVEVRGRTVLVNSTTLAEPYARFLNEENEGRGRDWGPRTVPPDHLFVLGDNRDNSKDSRHWGFLPAENLLGRATIVYYSEDRDGRIRWERIGLRLQ